MKPRIDTTQFGQITIEGRKYDFDIIIRLDGLVEKRKKILSKAIYGTSHIISLDEAKSINEIGAKKFIIGSGQIGFVKLSEEAGAFFEANKCEVVLLPTPSAAQSWNISEGAVIGLFHITC